MASPLVPVVSPEAASAGAILLPVRRFQPRRYRPGGLGAWSGHLPFANDLAAALRPSIFVELGSHYGESYFGFCQAVDENNIDCRCYAVDTWKGDSHSGFYGEGVFQDVREYNHAHYAAFSTLVRSTFDEANPQFADASIDLLHIDGLHTYDAVRRDFELWLPKLRAGGIVLMHDTNVRHADFHVWRFWEELSERYETFEFNHSWGLGVLRVPDFSRPQTGLLELLFSGSQANRHAVREHYAFAADFLELTRQPAGAARGDAPKSFLQVFGDRAGIYMEAGSSRAEVQPGEWRTCSVELVHGADSGELRLDVADYPCIAEISGIAVRRASDNVLLFEYTTPNEIESCRCEKDLVLLPRGESARFLSCGVDPQLIVAAPKSVRLDLPIVVEVVMRILPGLEGAAPPPEIVPPLAAERNPAVELKLAFARVESIRAELCHQQSERVALVSELRRALAERDAFAREKQMDRSSLASEQELRIQIEQDAAVFRLNLAREQSRNAELELAVTRLRGRVLHLRKERLKFRSGLRGRELELASKHGEAALLRFELDEEQRQLGAAESALKDREARFEEDHLKLRDALRKLELALHAKDADATQLRSDIGHDRLQLEDALRSTERELRARGERMLRLHAEVEMERARRDDVLHSLSWRITRPLRAVYGLFVRG